MSSFFDSVEATDGTEGANLDVTTYARKTNGVYTIFVASTSIELEGIYEITQSAYSYDFLKDYLEVGDTWSSNYTIFSSYVALIDGLPVLPDSSIDVNSEFEILERDASHTVNGVVYSPVIKIRQSSVYIYPGIPNSSAEIEMYFAKDVGMIKSITTSYDGDDAITSTAVGALINYVLN